MGSPRLDGQLELLPIDSVHYVDGGSNCLYYLSLSSKLSQYLRVSLILTSFQNTAAMAKIPKTYNTYFLAVIATVGGML